MCIISGKSQFILTLSLREAAHNGSGVLVGAAANLSRTILIIFQIRIQLHKIIITYRVLIVTCLLSHLIYDGQFYL